MQQDTTWKDFLYAEPLAKANNVTTDQITPLLWMMYPHSAMQCKYSEYHTFRIQLHGAATYFIISPDSAASLHLFPSIHVSAYQSQVEKHMEFKSKSKSTRLTIYCCC